MRRMSKFNSFFDILRFSLIFITIVVFLGVFVAVPMIKKWNFNRFLNSIQNEEDFKNSVLSITAKYEGSDKNLMNYNSDKRLHPGSNFKLFTAAAALEYLGSKFTFKTSLYLWPHENKKNLVLVGGGDPSFKQKDFAGFVEKVAATGKISGDIYYDDGYFTGEEFGPGWAEDWKDQYFSVPITGLQINDNLLEIRFGEIGETGRFGIETKPIENYKKIINQLNYVDSAEKFKKDVTARMDEDGNIVLEGDTMQEFPFRTSSTVKDPSLITALVLKQELLKKNLIRKNVQVLEFPATAKSEKLVMVYEYASPPLPDIVFQMLKFSKNNYAETLIRTLGKEVATKGTQKDGVEVLNGFFQEIGISENEVSAFDGSGLSPSTRVTGNSILNLFEYANTRPWKDVFWKALPESQVDGTLKHRFEKAGLSHQVVAKTGTHEFSSSLSGKILRENGNILFSVHFYNHPFSTEESVQKIIPVIDKIVALLDKQF